MTLKSLPDWASLAIKIATPVFVVAVAAYILLQTLQSDVSALQHSVPNITKTQEKIKDEQIRIKYSDKNQNEIIKDIKSYMVRTESTTNKILEEQREMQVDIRVIQEQLKKDN